MTTSCATEPAAETLPADVLRLLRDRLPAAADICWHARSGTTLDTGSWLARGRLHLLVCGNRLVMVAAGPRPYVLDLPVAVLSQAVYNHVTGELSFPEAAQGPSLPAVRLDPLLARSLMEFAPSSPHPNPSAGIPSHA
jgi:hypothetical protein